MTEKEIEEIARDIQEKRDLTSLIQNKSKLKRFINRFNCNGETHSGTSYSLDYTPCEELSKDIEELIKRRIETLKDRLKAKGVEE